MKTEQDISGSRMASITRVVDRESGIRIHVGSWNVIPTIAHADWVKVGKREKVRKGNFPVSPFAPEILHFPFPRPTDPEGRGVGKRESV